MPRSFETRRQTRLLVLFVFFGTFSLLAARGLADEVKDTKKLLEVPAAFLKPAPDGLDDLKAMEIHVKSIVEKVTPCTVCVRMGNSFLSSAVQADQWNFKFAALVTCIMIVTRLCGVNAAQELRPHGLPDCTQSRSRGRMVEHAHSARRPAWGAAVR